MELTSILGTSFLVNVDSVVYAYTRGSESTLVMSRNKELVYVTESVAEVVTASGTGLVAFTSTSGDVTGSVAINPNYIQKVTSVDGGDSSGLVLGDSNGISATLVVTTDYANIDAIVEASAGGGALTVVAKTADFTADGASGTVYTNEGATIDITATIGDVAVGTEYTFLGASDEGTLIKVVPFTGDTINYVDTNGNEVQVPASGADVYSSLSYGVLKIVKVTSTLWIAVYGYSLTSTPL